MIESLINFIEGLGNWGYLIVFLIIALECQPMLGLFMPGESIVLASGFLASRGSLDLQAVIFVISCAAIIGDTVGYELGRKLGRGWLERHGPRVGLREAQLLRCDSFISRHGSKAAFAAHFMHLFRSLVPFIAGSSRMRYGSFVAYNGLGCVAWAGINALLGYFLGASWALAEKWIGRGSVVIGIIAAVGVLLVLAWRWLSKHETIIRRRCQAVVDHRWMVRFRARFGPQLRFLHRRISPEGFLGLHLTLGTLILLAACWLFATLLGDGPLADRVDLLDQRVERFFQANTAPWLTRGMLALSMIAAGPFVVTAMGVFAVALAWRHDWYRLLSLGLVGPGGALVNILVHELIQRRNEHAIATLDNLSFPSGHTLNATLFFGLLAAFAVASSRGWALKTCAFMGALFVILLVALSRLALGLHDLSDVLGGIALGAAWLAVCLTAVETLRRWRGRIPPGGAGSGVSAFHRSTNPVPPPAAENSRTQATKTD